jgi:hypothetical protein
MTRVLPDVLKDAEARGLEVTEAQVYAHADAFADRRSASDQAVDVRPHGTSRGRESHRGRPGHRRTRSIRAGPSDDDGPGEPPPAAPRLTLAPKPKVLLTFACLTPEQRGEV